MKFLTFLLLLLSTVFVTFAENEEYEIREEVSQNVEISQSIDSLQNIEITKTARKRVDNHRYTIISAIMMMLFLGLCMTSASTINPE